MPHRPSHEHPEHTHFALHQKLDDILRLLRLTYRLESIMAVDLTKIEAAVKANTDAEKSAQQLLKQLSDKVSELSQTTQDPAVQALADQINANTAAWAAAIVANTPAGAAAPAAPAAPEPSSTPAAPAPAPEPAPAPAPTPEGS